MTRALWITDIHLNFVKPDKHKELIDAILREKPDMIWLGGDIGEADTVVEYLEELDRLLTLPMYFVLGNHDFYNGSFRSVRSKVQKLVRGNSRLHLLGYEGVFRINDQTGLIGHGGWADGRLGDWAGSTIMLNDYLTITDFKKMLGRSTEGTQQERMKSSQAERLAKMQSLAEESAAHFRKLLPEALERFEHVYVLTHVPPWKEACWYEGKHSDDNYLPHFSNKAAGDVLYEIMAAHPKRRMTVLCGHTHGEGKAQILPNLECLTGGATYGVPYVQQVFEFA